MKIIKTRFETIVSPCIIALCATVLLSCVEQKPKHQSTVQTQSGSFLQQKPDEFNTTEHRIARHFEIDTLPGLMRHGLVKKYERHSAGTTLFVVGKIWQARSKYFQESLLREILIYNKVHGYELHTQVIDVSSHRLYACAVSFEHQEYFD